MTPEQKAQFEANMQAMTPEQRAQFLETMEKIRAMQQK
jgi:Spy/CpxP family protein refolding chaperone